MEILKEYAEYIVGIPSTIIATVISIWIFRRQHNNKKLKYIILANEEILNYNHEIADKIKIEYEGKEISKLSMLKIAIWNKGSSPIPKSDFETNISINLGKEVEILNSEIVSQDPHNMNIEIGQKKSKVYIKPFLINQQDNLTIKIIADNKIENISVCGRIAGVRNIDELKITRIGGYIPKIYWIALSITVTILSLILFYNYIPKN